MYKVTVLDEAKEMLKNHLKFLARVSPNASRKLNKQFNDVLKILAQTPLTYPLWLTDFELTKPYRRFIFGKRYLAIYTVEDNRVIVAYVLDCRMNNVELFDNSDNE